MTGASADWPSSDPEAEDLRLTIDRAEFMRVARTIIDARHERLNLLPAEMFGEPAWDMLLELYARGEGSRASVAELVQVSDAPPSTALRWIDFLEKERLIAKEVERTSQPRLLTSKARRALDSLFCKLLSSRTR